MAGSGGLIGGEGKFGLPFICSSDDVMESDRSTRRRLIGECTVKSVESGVPLRTSRFLFPAKRGFIPMTGADRLVYKESDVGVKPPVEITVEIVVMDLPTVLVSGCERGKASIAVGADDRGFGEVGVVVIAVAEPGFVLYGLCSESLGFVSERGDSEAGDVGGYKCFYLVSA